MNKGIFIAIIALFLLTGIGLFLYSQNKPTTNTAPSTTSENAPATTDSRQGTFWELASAGKNLECSFSFASSNATTNGTAYVSGAKLRTDVVTSAGGQTVNTYMIKDGDYIYTWNSNVNQGIKMKFDQATAPSPTTSATAAPSTQAPDLSQSYQYDCKDWNVDDSKFTLPTNIQFMDISAQGSQAGGAKVNACSTCDKLTDEAAKAACKKALNC